MLCYIRCGDSDENKEPYLLLMALDSIALSVWCKNLLLFIKKIKLNTISLDKLNLVRVRTREYIILYLGYNRTLKLNVKENIINIK